MHRIDSVCYAMVCDRCFCCLYSLLCSLGRCAVVVVVLSPLFVSFISIDESTCLLHSTNSHQLFVCSSYATLCCGTFASKPCQCMSVPLCVCIYTNATHIVHLYKCSPCMQCSLWCRCRCVCIRASVLATVLVSVSLSLTHRACTWYSRACGCRCFETTSLVVYRFGFWSLSILFSGFCFLLSLPLFAVFRIILLSLKYLVELFHSLHHTKYTHIECVCVWLNSLSVFSSSSFFCSFGMARERETQRDKMMETNALLK